MSEEANSVSSSSFNHAECNKKTLLLFETVSNQIAELSTDIKTFRNDLTNSAVDRMRLTQELISLRREMEDNVKPRIKQIETTLEDSEKEEKDDFKQKITWLISVIAIGISIAAIYFRP